MKLTIHRTIASWFQSPDCKSKQNRIEHTISVLVENRIFSFGMWSIILEFLISKKVEWDWKRESERQIEEKRNNLLQKSKTTENCSFFKLQLFENAFSFYLISSLDGCKAIYSSFFFVSCIQRFNIYLPNSKMAPNRRKYWTIYWTISLL